MNIYKTLPIADRIRGNSYVGRGIVLGLSEDGEKAVAAYFIMGRSANSRNRIFTVKQGEVFTEPFDAAKVEDPSLIIYAALRQFEYKNVISVNTKDTLEKTLSQLATFKGPIFLEVQVRKGNRKDLGRPTTTPIQNKEALMEFLKK